MDHSAHAPFGTSGGGSAYMKWEDARNRHVFLELDMETGAVRVGESPARVRGGRAEMRLLATPDWVPLRLPTTIHSCNARRGDTLLNTGDESYVLINLPSGRMRTVKRVPDRAEGAEELFDGYWYETLSVYETRCVYDETPDA